MDKKDLCTPVKGFLEKATARRKHSCDSPLYLMQNVSTPPSRLMKIKNPFEQLLTENLHTHFLSPSIMVSNKFTPREKSGFKWNIDDISMIKPADIDETSLQQHESIEDPAVESFAQANIDRFFSMKEIVPSPFHKVNPKPLVNLVSTKDTGTQTTLTLPFNLPPEVETALKPYFTYNEEQAQSNALFKKLFDIQHDSNESFTSDERSPIRRQLSPTRFLGFVDNIPKRCDFSPPKHVVDEDIVISPVCRTARKVTQLKTRCKSVSSLNFTSKMSLDGSTNVLPNNKSLDNSYEAMEESCHTRCDMDCKSITIMTPSSKGNSGDEMDVSNSNTPHSRIFSNSRKKLSDSFLSDDEPYERTSNTKFQDGINDKATSSKLTLDNMSDGGYLTASYNNTEDSNSVWTSEFISTSTPTKNKCKN